MDISLILSVGKNNEIGKNNDLVWHFHEDMKFFRETTTGNTVIMGRKTFESLPKVLPNRRNIVISSDKDLQIEGAEVVHSLDEALNERQCFCYRRRPYLCRIFAACNKALFNRNRCGMPGGRHFLSAI